MYSSVPPNQPPFSLTCTIDPNVSVRPDIDELPDPVGFEPTRTNPVTEASYERPFDAAPHEFVET